jgi:tRNA U34 5-carboxymethylaminomethyl modifying GTPase MnmE/TrmE
VVADLDRCEHSSAARSAAAQCRRILGSVKCLLAQLRQIAHAGRSHAGFSEEDIDFLQKADAATPEPSNHAGNGDAAAVQGAIRARASRWWIAGQPNAGKSFAERWPAREVAITPIAGTTRAVSKLIQIRRRALCMWWTAAA